MSIHLRYGNLTWGVNIFVRDEACRVSDDIFIPEGEISLSHMDLVVMDYFSPITFFEKHEINVFSFKIQ